MVELPLEVLFTIFSKLPIKSLMRLKCVSKHWSRVIGGDPCFATMQMNNHNFEDTQVLFLLQRANSCFIEPQCNHGTHVFKVDMRHLDDEFNVIAPKYELEGSCNGLLLFKNHTERVVWCNPLTQEIATFLCQGPQTFLENLLDTSRESLWRTSHWLARHGIGFDSLSRQYKMVHILAKWIKVHGSVCCINVAAKVANLEGIDLSWRDIKNFPVHHLHKRAIYACGCLHWTTLFHGKIVVSFLLDKEEFVSTPLPNNLWSVDLVEIGGFLGCFKQTSCGKINVWVKKELRGEWIKEYEINFPGKSREYCYSTEVIGSWKNGEVLLLNNPEGLFSYNKESNSLTHVPISVMEFNSGAIIPMRGTIASISKFIQT